VQRFLNWQGFIFRQKHGDCPASADREAVCDRTSLSGDLFQYALLPVVIDTLAAAYAEAGDFKRAIEFQGQALRTGNPSESEQKEMRERLSLYEESKPFRDKPDKP
jgi:hypothetical protein